MASELLIILALMLANGLFAGAEIAVLSVRKTRLREFIRRRDRRALAVKSLRDHPERFLATVQIAMTVIGTAAAALGGAAISVELTRWLISAGVGSYADELSIAIVIAT